jgi:hypothetical protein
MGFETLGTSAVVTAKAVASEGIADVRETWNFLELGAAGRCRFGEAALLRLT